MDEVKVNATLDDVEKLKESIIWNDIVRELMSWKRGFELEMMSIVDESADRNPSSASILMHIGDINGRVKTVDYILSLPEVFTSIIELQNSERKEDQ